MLRDQGARGGGRTPMEIGEKQVSAVSSQDADLLDDRRHCDGTVAVVPGGLWQTGVARDDRDRLRKAAGMSERGATLAWAGRARVDRGGMTLR